jgi:hypothetical protein
MEEGVFRIPFDQKATYEGLIIKDFYELLNNFKSFEREMLINDTKNYLKEVEY